MAECKYCARPIRWQRTRRGKWQPLEVTGEPHHPCPGAPRVATRSKPDRHTGSIPEDRLYYGERPPWDYPGPFIACVESEADLEPGDLVTMATFTRQVVKHRGRRSDSATPVPPVHHPDTGRVMADLWASRKARARLKRRYKGI